MGKDLLLCREERAAEKAREKSRRGLWGPPPPPHVGARLRGELLQSIFSQVGGRALIAHVCCLFSLSVLFFLSSKIYLRVSVEESWQRVSLSMQASACGILKSLDDLVLLSFWLPMGSEHGLQSAGRQMLGPPAMWTQVMFLRIGRQAEDLQAQVVGSAFDAVMRGLEARTLSRPAQASRIKSGAARAKPSARLVAAFPKFLCISLIKVCEIRATVLCSLRSNSFLFRGTIGEPATICAAGKSKTHPFVAESRIV